jgi:excisionase family DNA binding protein
VSDHDLAAALLGALDEAALAALAERLRPHLAAADDERPLLDPRQAAARLRLHEKTVVRMAREGRLPGAIRIGKGWRFDPAGLVPQPPVHPAAPATPERRAAPAARSHAAVRAIRGEPTPRRRDRA